MAGQRFVRHGVTLGNCFVNAGCLFDPGESFIVVEDAVALAHRVTLVATSHEIGPAERRSGARSDAPIRVCRGAWIGTGAVILPGVVVGAGSVVAAGAVVTKDVEPNTLVAGVPARLIRRLESLPVLPP
jgi:maltose O-acetyltransferase